MGAAIALNLAPVDTKVSTITFPALTNTEISIFSHGKKVW